MAIDGLWSQSGAAFIPLVALGVVVVEVFLKFADDTVAHVDFKSRGFEYALHVPDASAAALIVPGAGERDSHRGWIQGAICRPTANAIGLVRWGVIAAPGAASAVAGAVAASKSILDGSAELLKCGFLELLAQSTVDDQHVPGPPREIAGQLLSVCRSEL